MTLYLVKLDPENQDKRGEPRFVAVVGRIIEVRPAWNQVGYRFLPQTAAHKASRKVWPDSMACIPKWTRKCGFLRLYDNFELDAARAAVA